MYEDTRQIIGRKRTLEILDLRSRHETLNYMEIETTVATSSDVISGSLDTLVGYKLIDRIAESQRNVRYTITDDGKTVLDAVDDITTFLA